MSESEFKYYVDSWSDDELVAYAEDAFFVSQLATEELNELIFELSSRFKTKLPSSGEEDLMGVPIGGDDDSC